MRWQYTSPIARNMQSSSNVTRIRSSSWIPNRSHPHQRKVPKHPQHPVGRLTAPSASEYTAAIIPVRRARIFIDQQTPSCVASVNRRTAAHWPTSATLWVVIYIYSVDDCSRLYPRNVQKCVRPHFSTVVFSLISFCKRVCCLLQLKQNPSKIPEKLIENMFGRFTAVLFNKLFDNYYN